MRMKNFKSKPTKTSTKRFPSWWRRSRAYRMWRDFKNGIFNLWRWLPLVWSDRDWDHAYITRVLRFKLQNTAAHLEKYDRFVGVEHEVKYIRLCIKLMDKIAEEEYIFRKLPDGTIDPNGILQHEKAKRIMYRIMAEHFERWWD